MSALIRSRDKSGTASAKALSKRPSVSTPVRFDCSPLTRYMWEMDDALSSVTMPDILRRQLVAEAKLAAPEECCGLLFGEMGQVRAIQSITNVAGQPLISFEINPAQLIKAEVAARAGGPSVLGYYHSHPNGRSEPSLRDAESAAPDGRVWIIIAGQTITAWRAVADGPWLGRFLPLDIEFVT